MASELPLDDVVGRTFYINGATWRLVYNRGIRCFALKRVAPEIPFDRAVELITSGELLWDPPARFEPLRPGDAADAVQQQVALLDAFCRSPAGTASTDWALRARIDARRAEARAWLARRALPSGEPTEETGGGTE